MERKNIVFLIYINRSGSTFLAGLLDRYVDIGVSLEAMLPDGIICRPIAIKKNKDIEIALKRLFLDTKLTGWNLNKNNLIKELSRLNKSIKFNGLLFALLDCYFNYDRKINTYVYKCGQYYKYINEVKKIFQNSKFIFILRDGRAIYNSQKKSLDSKKGKPMTKNPIIAAEEYVNMFKKIKIYRSEKWFYLLKYEELVKNYSSTLEKLLVFLGSKGKYNEKSGYLNNIPNSQKHLHKNIDVEPLLERVDAWKYELSKEEIKIYESIAGRTLKILDYNLFLNGNKPDRKVYLYYKIDKIKQIFIKKVSKLFTLSSFLDIVWRKLRYWNK